MTTLYNDYQDEIRRDIAKDFGLEAAGYNPATYITPAKAKQMVEAYHALSDEQKEALRKRRQEMRGF